MRIISIINDEPSKLRVHRPPTNLIGVLDQIAKFNWSCHISPLTLCRLYHHIASYRRRQAEIKLLTSPLTITVVHF